MNGVRRCARKREEEEIRGRAPGGLGSPELVTDVAGVCELRRQNQHSLGSFLVREKRE
jgi:hypothetical protein